MKQRFIFSFLFSVCLSMELFMLKLGILLHLGLGKNALRFTWIRGKRLMKLLILQRKTNTADHATCESPFQGLLVNLITKFGANEKTGWPSRHGFKRRLCSVMEKLSVLI